MYTDVMTKTATTKTANPDCTKCDGTGTDAVFLDPCDCHIRSIKKAHKAATPSQIDLLTKLLAERTEAYGDVADWIQEAVTFSVSGGDFFGTGKLPPAGQARVLIEHQVRTTT